MSNIVTIKHGTGLPTTEKLERYQLGYSDDKKGLFIRDGSDDIVSLSPSSSADLIDEKVIEINSTDGVNYTATIPGITSLKRGMMFVAVPNMTSTTSKVYLNVNGTSNLRLSASSTTSTESYTDANVASWVSKNFPIFIIYDGTRWKAINYLRTNLAHVTGTLLMSNGGTGTSCNNLTELKEYLGIKDVDLSNYAKADLSNIQTINGTYDTSSNTYVAENSNITSLKKGLLVILIPNASSDTTNPKLQINTFDAKDIYSLGTSTISTTNNGRVSSWISANYPVFLLYDGSAWRVLNYTNVNLTHATGSLELGSASLTSGTLPISRGGTGFSSSSNDNAVRLAELKEYLGITSIDLTGYITSESLSETLKGYLPLNGGELTGDLYFKYPDISYTPNISCVLKSSESSQFNGTLLSFNDELSKYNTANGIRGIKIGGCIVLKNGYTSTTQNYLGICNSWGPTLPSNSNVVEGQLFFKTES